MKVRNSEAELQVVELGLEMTTLQYKEKAARNQSATLYNISRPVTPEEINILYPSFFLLVLRSVT